MATQVLTASWKSTSVCPIRVSMVSVTMHLVSTPAFASTDTLVRIASQPWMNAAQIRV